MASTASGMAKQIDSDIQSALVMVIHRHPRARSIITAASDTPPSLRSLARSGTHHSHGCWYVVSPPASRNEELDDTLCYLNWPGWSTPLVCTVWWQLSCVIGKEAPCCLPPRARQRHWGNVVSPSPRAGSGGVISKPATQCRRRTTSPAPFPGGRRHQGWCPSRHSKGEQQSAGKGPLLWASVLSTAAQHISRAHAIITARKDWPATLALAEWHHTTPQQPVARLRQTACRLLILVHRYDGWNIHEEMQRMGREEPILVCRVCAEVQ